MQIVPTQIWILALLLILPVKMLCDQPAQRNSMKHEDFDRKSSVNNILSDLRNNWQSPISYLQTRGYIPPQRGQTYNVQFRTKGQKIKGREGVRPDKNKKPISGCDANTNKINMNFDNTALKSNTNGLNEKPNNFNPKLSTPLKINTDLNTKLNLNSALKNNHKIDSYSSANVIARLKADSAGNSISSLNSSPNIITELNPVANLHAYTDMNNDLNQPPSVPAKSDQRTFLHNVKNKFLGFFRGRPDVKNSSSRQSFAFDNYNDFSEPVVKEFRFGDDKLDEISNLYGKVTDPEIERIIQRGLRKDNEYDKEFLSSTANKDLLTKLGKFV